MAFAARNGAVWRDFMKNCKWIAQCVNMASRSLTPDEIRRELERDFVDSDSDNDIFDDLDNDPDFVEEESDEISSEYITFRSRN